MTYLLHWIGQPGNFYAFAQGILRIRRSSDFQGLARHFNPEINHFVSYLIVSRLLFVPKGNNLTQPDGSFTLYSYIRDRKKLYAKSGNTNSNFL
jgi:hypothetical protein